MNESLNTSLPGANVSIDCPFPFTDGGAHCVSYAEHLGQPYIMIACVLIALHAVLLFLFLLSWMRHRSEARNTLSVSDLFEDQEAEEDGAEASGRDALHGVLVRSRLATASQKRLYALTCQ